ncbi:hypothetical protein B2J93_450 [Marssonina coronariae]|uniref:Uncharacterized protein n=1 Tax=Diplocarpon coronariae TaxID=2795749 RepID=A0A218YT47_9HELO|nr:hypothetical protein B2J93_450 [Marssonina coronariae]
MAPTHRPHEPRAPRRARSRARTPPVNSPRARAPIPSGPAPASRHAPGPSRPPGRHKTAARLAPDVRPWRPGTTATVCPAPPPIDAPRRAAQPCWHLAVSGHMLLAHREYPCHPPSWERRISFLLSSGAAAPPRRATVTPQEPEALRESGLLGRVDVRWRGASTDATHSRTGAHALARARGREVTGRRSVERLAPLLTAPLGGNGPGPIGAERGAGARLVPIAEAEHQLPSQCW